MLGYMPLAELYRLSFLMKTEFGYSKDEFFDMLPYERDIEVGMLLMELERKKQEN